MQNLMEALSQELRAGRPAMLCTIIESRGSAPRGAGAKMALLQNGEALGTIGGGVMEHLAQQHGKEALAQGRSLLDSFCLSAGQAASIGMVCGGSVRVFFQYCAPEDAPFFTAVAEALSKDEDVWLATQMGPGAAWLAGLYGPEKSLLGGHGFPPEVTAPHMGPRAALVESGGNPPLFIEPLSQSGLVYIFGGGHISQELTPLLAHVGFRPVIFEDRPAFVQESLFPGAAAVLLGDFNDVGKTIAIRRQDYIAIMTRGHVADHAVLEQALRSPARYVGLIGSRSKFSATCDKLRAAGFNEADIGRIRNPIGLPILAETPAEIAVSIAAELIQHRAQRP